MAEEQTERPTLPEQQAQQDVKPQLAEQKVDPQTLLARLEALGISDEKRLQGVYDASTRYGQMASTLGAIREENQRLRAALESRTTPQPQQNEPYAEGQAIDLRKELKSAIRDFYRDEVMEPQRKFEQQYWSELEQIQGSEHFSLIKDKWPAHIQAPAVQKRLRLGETTLIKEYSDLVLKEYRDIAVQARDVIKQAGNVMVKPPHVESGAKSQPIGRVSDRDERKEEILKKWTGTDKDIDNMLDLVFDKPR